MEEALVATKVLAEDCRLRGTAFRLGVCLFLGQMAIYMNAYCIVGKLYVNNNKIFQQIMQTY